MRRLSHFRFCKQHHGSAEMTDGRCCGPEGTLPQSMRHPAERSSCYPISTRFSTGKPYLGLACWIRVACRRHRGASRRPHPDVRSSYRPSIWVRLAALAGGGSKPTTPCRTAQSATVADLSRRVTPRLVVLRPGEISPNPLKCSVHPEVLPNRAVHVDLAPPGPSRGRPWSSSGVPFCRACVRAGHPVMMTARRL
jgi:hypothetical protein